MIFLKKKKWMCAWENRKVREILEAKSDEKSQNLRAKQAPESAFALGPLWLRRTKDACQYGEKWTPKPGFPRQWCQRHTEKLSHLSCVWENKIYIKNLLAKSCNHRDQRAFGHHPCEDLSNKNKAGNFDWKVPRLVMISAPLPPPEA